MLSDHITDPIGWLYHRHLASHPAPATSYLRPEEEPFLRVVQGHNFCLIFASHGLAGTRKNQLFLREEVGAMVYLAVPFHLEHNTPQKA